MAEVDGLGALQVRVARHRPVDVRLGDLHDHGLQVRQRLDRPQRVRAREHRHVGRDLVVARARGVQLAADRADDLRQPPLDGHVDVLVGVQELELAGVELLRHPIEPAEQLVEVGVADDAGGREHPRVGARLLDVVGREAPVEADRSVQGDEHRIGREAEAGHGPGIMTQDGSGRPPRPPHRSLRAAAVRVGTALLHRLRGVRAACARAPGGRVHRARARRELRLLHGRDGRRDARGPRRRVPGAAGRQPLAAVRPPDAAQAAAVALAGDVRAPARRRARRPVAAGGRLLRRRAGRRGRLAAPRDRAPAAGRGAHRGGAQRPAPARARHRPAQRFGAPAV